MGTEGPPQFCVRMQWGKRSHFAFWARFIFSTKVISSLSLLLPRPIAKEEAALRNVFLLSFEMELETTARLQAKYAWSWNSTSANQGGTSEDWFGQVEGRQELGWDKSNKFVG